MSIIHVRQICSHLEATFGPLIDMTDLVGASDDIRKPALLTRAQAAFAIRHLCDVEEMTAASTVIDGAGDNGVDAVHFDAVERILYLVQSKWHNDGHGSISLGDAKKFLDGFGDLINSRYDRFNAKIGNKTAQIESALLDANSKIVLVFCYNGVEPLSDKIVRDLQDLLSTMNDTTDVVSIRVLKQADLHNILSQGAKGAPINLDVVLYEWGQTREPYRAYYGQVAATDLAEWYNKFHPRLFAPNIRMFLGTTGVNEGLMETLRASPSNFWYFNNGITALCSSIKKKPQGGANRDTGIFECVDVTIVNGAQTVGSIAIAARNLGLEKLGGVRVHIRLISLEHCPPELASQITRATNTQNRIDSRDFVSLDPEQERLRNELMIDGIEYVYKSGDVVLNFLKGFDLTEATVALACSQRDPALAVQAKREISKLWDDIGKPPYKRLFNPKLTGRRLWRTVRIQRAIDKALSEVREEAPDKLVKITVHGNRFIAAQVFASISEEEVNRDEADIFDIIKTLDGKTKSIAENVQAEIEKQFPGQYLQSLFKNAAKCADIYQAIKANQ